MTQIMKLTLDELQLLRDDDKLLKITENQHIKINNFLDNTDDEVIKIFINIKPTKLKLTLISQFNKINLFLKKKTEQDIINDQLELNNPFNDYKNVEYWN